MFINIEEAIEIDGFIGIWVYRLIELLSTIVNVDVIYGDRWFLDQE